MKNNLSDAAVEFEALPIATICLENAQINQAKQLICLIQHESRQWQAYLNALALFAFEQWLDEWGNDIHYSRDDCSVFHPQYANVLGAVCNLNVGRFKLCLIPRGSLMDETIASPRAIIELPEFVAHFYVVVDVLEELKQVTIYGFGRYDQLLSRLHSTPLSPEPDWMYRLPLSWFDNPADSLLLYLRCLEAEAIALPTIPTWGSETVSIAELEPLLPKLQSEDWELWEVLSWEQAKAILTTPKLLHWLLNPTAGTPTLQSIKEPIVNVGLWLRDEMDELAQKLEWVLLPAFTPDAIPLRSPAQELQVLLQELERSGKVIPPVARGAYSDFKLGEIPLRLYAVTWSLLSPQNLPAWTLLLILGATPGMGIFQDVKLLLSDESQVLVERVLQPNQDKKYIYAQVGGTIDEVFTVTLATTEGVSLTLPAFVFNLN